MKQHIPRIQSKVRAARAAFCAFATLAAASSGAAIVEGRTNDGHRYMAGGIGTEEVDALRGQASAYSLQLITAARGGAYLAGTHVRITGPAQQVVLDTTIDAPWLLVDLPRGRYTVQASHSGRTLERNLTIAPGHSQQVVLHFDTPVDQEGRVEPVPHAMPR